MTPRTFGWLALAVGAVSCNAAAPGQIEGDRVLVFTKTAAFRHASIEPGVEMLRELAAELGVGLDATEEAGAFTVENLARYRAVVFLSTTGDVLNERQQSALRSFINGGGGYMGIHAASDTEYGWPWYGELVGAYFDGHPGNPGVRTGTLLVVDADHPATSSLPDRWVRDDEWYDLRDMQSGLIVLLDIDETSYKTPAESPSPDPRPIAWYRTFDGGRTFYTALGHTVESYSEPLFRAHVRGGLEWVLGR